MYEIVTMKSGPNPNIRVFLLSLILLMLVITMIPKPVPAQTRPIYGIVDVSFDNDEKYKQIEVGPGMPGVVHFKGEVILERHALPRLYNVIVDLEAMFDQETDIFLASVSPPIIFLGPNNTTAFFTLNVRALPLSTETGSNRDLKISVGGEWSTIPGFAGGPIGFDEHVLVGINQYYDIRIISPDVLVKIWPGYSTATFEIQIRNFGNGVDTFRIEILNLLSLTAEGFAFDVKTWEITIDEKQWSSFNLTVEPPKDNFPMWKTKLTMIPIKITSKNSEYNREENPIRDRQYAVFVYEDGIYFSGISIVVIALLVCIIYAMIWRRRKRKGIKRRKKKKSKK